MPIRLLVRTAILGTFYLMVAAVVAVILFFGFPFYDSVRNPVLRDQTVTHVTVSDTRVCWTWAFTKTREAKVIGVGFSVLDKDGDEAVLIPFREDTSQPFDGRGKQRSPGRHAIALCANLPEGIQSPWLITGHLEYESNRPWRVIATLPAIETNPPVPATKNEGGG